MKSLPREIMKRSCPWDYGKDYWGLRITDLYRSTLCISIIKLCNQASAPSHDNGRSVCPSVSVCPSIFPTPVHQLVAGCVAEHPRKCSVESVGSCLDERFSSKIQAGVPEAKHFILFAMCNVFSPYRVHYELPVCPSWTVNQKKRAASQDKSNQFIYRAHLKKQPRLRTA